MATKRFVLLMLDQYGGAPETVGYARPGVGDDSVPGWTLVTERSLPARAVLKIHDTQAYAGNNPYVRGRIAAGKVEACPEHGYQHAEDFGAHGIGCSICAARELAADNVRLTLRASDNVRPDVLDEGAHERGEAECAMQHHMVEARGGR